MGSEKLPHMAEFTSAPPRTSVLVAEDDPALARSLRRVLEAAGFKVTVATDGKEAVDAMLSGSFDVVLSDIQMPGMTGIQLLGLVRARDIDVPVILMTGVPTVDTAMEAVSLGALQYLAKPIANDVLVKAVQRASHLHAVARMKREALEVAGRADAVVADREQLEALFEQALENMWMAFQPIVDATRGRIFGYEALLRVRLPSFPHPGAVLGAAERLSRLDDLGRRVRALSAEAFDHASSDALLFVNLHTQDLLDPSLYESDGPLTKMAERVVLEITERSTLDHVKDVTARVAQLRARGFRIAIDDLGAGYAGLSSFAALEPEIVKLDMSLIRNMHQSPIRQRLVGSMTALCKEMGMLVVAEGIEALEEQQAVRAFGCNLLQGYRFAKPGPPFPVVEAFP